MKDTDGRKMALSDRLYLKDLACRKPSYPYQEDACFNLERFPSEGIKEQVRAFLEERAGHRAYSTLLTDRAGIEELAGFLAEIYPGLEDLSLADPEDLERKLKKYLLEKDREIFKIKKERGRGENMQLRRSVILLRALSEYLEGIREKDLPEEKKDVWHLERFSFPVRQNPVHPARTLSFRRIKNRKMREEIKTVCFLLLQCCSSRTVQGIILEGGYLAEYLEEAHPEV